MSEDIECGLGQARAAVGMSCWTAVSGHMLIGTGERTVTGGVASCQVPGG